jgi:hypothetical protein
MSKPNDFWSRRKARVEAEAAEDLRQAEEAEQRVAQAALEEKSDAEVLEELGLPDPDDLEPGQDISAFMHKAVPEHLRKRALRQLWRLNPILANLDGLNDYDGDFTNAATDSPGVATAYRVGKGLLKHIEALEKQAAAKELAATSASTDIPENPSELAAPCVISESDADSAEFTENLQDSAYAASASTTMVSGAVEYDLGVPLDTTTEEPVRPRRMRFRIESET